MGRHDRLTVLETDNPDGAAAKDFAEHEGSAAWPVSEFAAEFAAGIVGLSEIHKEDGVWCRAGVARLAGHLERVMGDDGKSVGTELAAGVEVATGQPAEVIGLGVDGLVDD